jgi:ABC-type dipeptide/oligopeptide/nickel transport system permease subunit
VAFCAVFRSWVAPYNPDEQDIPNKYATPSWSHLAGTDNLGRDIFSRLIYGAWTSLQVAIAVIVIAMAVSLVIGLFSGYIGGKTDNALMRVVDGGLAFPPLVLAIAVAGILGGGQVHHPRSPSCSCSPTRWSAGPHCGAGRAVRQASRVRSRTHRIRFRILPNVVAALVDVRDRGDARKPVSLPRPRQPPPAARLGRDLHHAYDLRCTRHVR